jgi:formylmethanofuran dehydrogenase subunit E
MKLKMDVKKLRKTLKLISDSDLGSIPFSKLLSLYITVNVMDLFGSAIDDREAEFDFAKMQYKYAEEIDRRIKRTSRPIDATTHEALLEMRKTLSALPLVNSKQDYPFYCSKCKEKFTAPESLPECPYCGWSDNVKKDV